MEGKGKVFPLFGFARQSQELQSINTRGASISGAQITAKESLQVQTETIGLRQ